MRPVGVFIALVLGFLSLLPRNLTAQEIPRSDLEFVEYMGYVRKYHPVVRQAELRLAEGAANLMRARGSFDPKIEIDYDRKKFKGTEYWDRLNTTFKIPTWYGIEFKANYEQNQGAFLNLDETLPDEGLFGAGVSVSLGEGLWINKRMASLQKARFFRAQTRAEQQLLVNEVLTEAAIAYFDWVRTYQDYQIFDDFLVNAQTRFEGVKRRALQGDMAMIDTVEAKIAVQNRMLSKEQAWLDLQKAGLNLSNFLWIEEVPVELQAVVRPAPLTESDVNGSLGLIGMDFENFNVEEHPKLIALQQKVKGLEVEKNLKVNQLLPKIDLEYNFLTADPSLIGNFETQQYKGGLRFSFPLFLRKERGELKLARIKLNDANYERDFAQVSIFNKVGALYAQVESYERQQLMIREMITNYRALLRGEERKFNFGESSVFLVNARESKLIDAELKGNALQNKFYVSKIKLFNGLALEADF